MKNVKIPLALLTQTIELLEKIDISEYGFSFQHDFDNVYFAFLKKQQAIELRDAYSQIIFAEDEDARFQARLRYLNNKRNIVDSDF